MYTKKGASKMAAQALPVNFRTMVVQQPRGTKISYPQVIGMTNQWGQQTINRKIHRLTESLFQQQFQQQEHNAFDQMIGTYEIKTNQRHILSLTLANYAIATHAANGLTLMKSLTIDVQTGESYQLKDLFHSGSDYVTVLSDLVQQQINSRKIPTIGKFNGISPNQDYYIADKCLVLYFQAIDFTPHYVGLPMFPISVYELENIVKESGPLGRMAADT